jgi:hypothetical protein
MQQSVQYVIQTKECCAGNRISSSRASSAERNQRHAQSPANDQQPVATTTTDVPLCPLLMQGSVCPAASDASTAVLPVGSGISFSAAGVCPASSVAVPGDAKAGAVVTHRLVPPPLMLTLSDDLNAVAAGMLLSAST